MRILHIASGFPTEDKPFFQPFIGSQIKSLEKLGLNIETFDVNGNSSIFNYFTASRVVRRIVEQKKIELISCTL